MKTFAFRRDYSEFGDPPEGAGFRLWCPECFKVYDRIDVVTTEDDARAHESWHYKALPDADFRGWLTEDDFGN